jgi:hypothetical protein
MATIGGSNIITNGLVLALDAANRRSYVPGSTIWNDISGNRYTGSLTNGPTFDSANGGSIVFDGTNDYIQKSSYRPFSTVSMSYEIIFKPNSNPTQGQGPLGSSDAEGTSPYFYVDYGGGSIKTYNAGSSPQYFTVQNLSLGSIYHFVCTRNGTTERNYVNSIESLGRSLNSTAGSNNGFDAVGGYSSLGWYINCNIYAIRIYNRALSPQEILQNYEALKSRYGL